MKPNVERLQTFFDQFRYSSPKAQRDRIAKEIWLVRPILSNMDIIKYVHRWVLK